MPAEAMRRAQELLDSGKLSPEKADKLRASMAKYQERVGAGAEPQSYSRGMLGDPRNLSGTAAIEAADEQLPERLPSLQEQDATQKKAQLQEWVREGQPAPTWQMPGAQLAQQTLEQQAGSAIDPVAQEMGAAQAKFADSAEMAANANLKNLSKDPTLFVPPTYQSQKSRTQPTAADAVPFLGHKVWYEPPLEQFRRDMGPSLVGAGIDPDKVTEEDPVYKRYADAMWGQAFKEAQQTDQSIVRFSQIDDQGDYGAKAVMAGVPHLLGGIMGAADTMTLGAAPEIAATALGAPQEELQQLRNMQEGPAGMVGAGLGALTPGGATQGLMRGASRMLPEAKGLGLGLLRSGGIGAATAGAEQLGTDVVQNLGDLSRGAGPTVGGQQMLENAGMAAGFGLGFGAGGEALARGAQAGKRALLERVPGLQVMEDAGIEPGIFKRYEPQGVKAARRRAVEQGLGEDTRSLASRELGQPMARAWRDVSELGTKGELPQLRHQVDEYFRSPEGATRMPVTNTANAVVDLLESRVDELGEELPFMMNMKQFEGVRDKLFETRQVTGSEASRMKEGGWRQIPGDAPQGMVTIGRPRQLNARELSEVIDSVDKLAGFTGKELTAPREAAWRRFNLAARKDRDMFAPNQWTRGPGGQLEMTTPEGETVTGFSALMGRLSEAKRESDRVISGAGLSGAPRVRAQTKERPTRLSDVRTEDRTAYDLASDASLNREYFDRWLESSDPQKTSLEGFTRRQLRDQHRDYIENRVMPVFDRSPRSYIAARMFTLGHDEPIRMVQRGMPPEEATRRYYDPAQADVSREEFTRRIQLAAEHIEDFLKQAPKATHVPTVYRGIGLDEFQVNRILEDGHFNNGGMTSSFSRNPVMAETFAFKKKTGEDRVPVLFKVKHKNGVGIESLSKIPGEEEVLLPGNASFRVTDSYRLRSSGTGSRQVLVIEGEEIGESLVGKAPRARSAVREGLDVEMSEGQNKALDKAIQSYRQTPGGARGDERLRTIARIAGVEEELKLFAGIEAAKGAGAREGVAAGRGGPRLWLAGSLPELASRGTRALNTVGAQPLGQAPKPSEELRALLRRLTPSVAGKDTRRGLGPFRMLGMASGGGSAFATALPSESNPQLLDPGLRGAVLGDKPAGELVYAQDALSAPEQGMLDRLAEAVGRGIGEKVKVQAPPEPKQEAAE